MQWVTATEDSGVKVCNRETASGSHNLTRFLAVSTGAFFLLAY